MSVMKFLAVASVGITVDQVSVDEVVVRFVGMGSTRAVEFIVGVAMLARRATGRLR